MKPIKYFVVNINDKDLTIIKYKVRKQCCIDLNTTPKILARCLRNGDLINGEYLVASSKEELETLYVEQYVVEHLCCARPKITFSVDADEDKDAETE